MTIKLVVLAAAVSVLAAAVVSTVNPATGSSRPKQVAPPPPPAPPVPGGGQFGAVLAGLSTANEQAFNIGKTDFMSIETVASGLGPVFNGKSCFECHFAAGVGGPSNITVTRFGRLTNGVFDPLTNLDGTLLHKFAIAPQAQESLPTQANVVAQRITLPLFGDGLIEAIPDSEIILNAQKSQPDGIHGVAAIITDVVSGAPHIGHFGWKAQEANLLAFSGDAYRNELGITNRFFPVEAAPRGSQALLAEFSTVGEPNDIIDPATGKGDVDRVTDFMRFLAPPPGVRQSVSAAAGSKLFTQMNCAACHTPTMTTGANAISALSNQIVPLYSDLLLHDMGSLGDGIWQAAANGNQMRTPPLWGLRVRNQYLHDGRAKTLPAAILAHAGEATAARNRFSQLTPAQVQQLVDFLNSI
jgi:CxxC motif-containing protein (DUF1111 family)